MTMLGIVCTVCNSVAKIIKGNGWDYPECPVDPSHKLVARSFEDADVVKVKARNIISGWPKSRSTLAGFAWPTDMVYHLIGEGVTPCGGKYMTYESRPEPSQHQWNLHDLEVLAEAIVLCDCSEQHKEFIGRLLNDRNEAAIVEDWMNATIAAIYEDKDGLRVSESWRACKA